LLQVAVAVGGRLGAEAGDAGRLVAHLWWWR
jgi:hypothetical protein